MCNKKIVHFPPFGGEGRSIDLLDNHLVLLGDSSVGGHGQFEYKSIHQPMKGLQGMKFTKELSPLGNAPRWHTSHAFGNLLLALGGEFQTEAQFSSSTTVWKGLSLRHNGSLFSRLAEGACKVRLEREIFLIIGGLKQVNGSKVETNTVRRLNVLEETLEDLPPIEKSRAFHSCEVYKKKVLISGGTKGTQIVADEVYILKSHESWVLKMTSSVQRYKHQLLRLGDRIFSFGGETSNGSQTALVEWFDWTARRWRSHEHSLLSENTTQLAITPFPLSAVDCDVGCSCGQARTSNKSRIVGGTDAEVHKSFEIFGNHTPVQENAYPWMVALIKDDEKGLEYVYTQCSGSLVKFIKDLK